MPLFISPVDRATDSNSNSLPGAKWYFYESGSLDPAPVYTTADLTTPHANPVEADAGGMFPAIYYDPGIAYRVIQTKANGEVIKDIDPYSVSLGGESVGLKSEISSPAISALTDRVSTTGYSIPGIGAAEYVYGEDVDASYVASNPRTSFLAADGRGFKLAGKVRDVFMFGVVGFQTGDTDLTCNDDGPALQAFFDDAFPEENQHLTFDLGGGEYMTGQGLFATYPVLTVGSLEFHVLRRFVGNCKIRPLPLSRQAGGVPMDYLLTIGGHHQHWDGMFALSGFDENGTCPAWADMRAKNAVRLFFATQSLFGKFDIEGFKRDCVYFDPSDDPVTFRAGTPFEVTYNYSNNIGVHFEHLFCRKYGTGTNAASNQTKSWAAKVHGGMPVGGPFDPTPASYVSSNQSLQRTKLSFDTTENFRRYDYGKVRLRILPATYTTIAADATAGTLTWAAGDPVAANLVVGDVIIPQSGANANKRLEILGFSGGSNRVIAVSSRIEIEAGNSGLVTEAATAVTGLYTRWTPYLVTDVLSSTEVLVWPWMEDRVGATGEWTFTAGFAANVTGSNTTTVSFDNLTGLNGAGTLNSQALYGPRVGSLRAEAVESGVVLGYTFSSSNLGTVVDHIHAEICEFNVIQTTTANAIRTIIKGGANFFKARCWAMNNKAAAGDALMPVRSLYNFTLDQGGEVLCNRQERTGSGVDTGTFSISNRNTERIAHRTQNGPITCNLDYDFEVGRLFGRHNWAEVLWIGPTGSAPTSTLTFALSAELTLRGWTIVGTNPISGPAKPCRVVIQFYSEAKKVLLNRFDAA